MWSKIRLEKQQQIINNIIQLMEKNPQWMKTWSSTGAGLQYNGATGTTYKSINGFNLWAVAMKKGYSDPRWVTFKQVKKMQKEGNAEIHVRKGEESPTSVMMFRLYDKKTKKDYDPKSIENLSKEEKIEYINLNLLPCWKYHNVFNAEQVENFPKLEKSNCKPKSIEKRNELVDKVIANSEAKVYYDGANEAYYQPSTDTIHLPKIKDFKDIEYYYATALHEIGHSTGAKNRLNRDMEGGFGSEKYAVEELIAELSSVFVQQELGVVINGEHLQNHAAYLSGWLKRAKEDKNVFFATIREAQKASNFIVEKYAELTQEKEEKRKNELQR